MTNPGVIDLGSPQGSGDQITSLTTIRGVAACWVVLLHFSGELFGVVPEASFLKPFVRAGHFAVPLFFILSGYVLGLRYLTKFRSPTARVVLHFWWLRLGRIYPVHLCTLAICLCLVARHRWPTDEGHTLRSFFANCLLTQAWVIDFCLTWNYPSWSISSEWFAYLIFPLAAYLLSHASRTWAAVLVVVACALSAGVYAYEDDLKLRGLAVVLPTFIGGVGLAIMCPPSNRIDRPQPWGELGLLAAVILPYSLGPSPFLSALYLALFFALVGFLGVSGHRTTMLWKNPSLFYLGNISYSLYMTHVSTFILINKLVYFDSLSGQPLAVRVLILLGCLFAAFGAAVSMHHIVERPFRDLSRRLSTSPKERASFSK